MSVRINGKDMDDKEALDFVERPDSVIHEVSVLVNNDTKVEKPCTMEGFDIKADFLIDMAEKSDELRAAVTIHLSKCGKLGNKDLIIIVRPNDFEESVTLKDVREKFYEWVRGICKVR